MAGWHYQLNGHGFGWALGVGDGQGGLECCSSWGCKESHTTEWLNWTECMERRGERTFSYKDNGWEFSIIDEGHESSNLGSMAMATHSSTLAWQIPWTEEPGRLQPMGWLGVGHDWVTSLSLFTFTHWRGNGNPLQCSCLENPRDRRAWWAAVYGSHRVGHDWSDLAAAAAAWAVSKRNKNNEIGEL